MFSTGPHLNFLGFAYFTAGRYEEAIAAFNENAKRGGPTGVEVFAYSIAAYSELGREEEAGAAAKKLPKKYPHFSLRSWVWLRLYKNFEDAERLSNAFCKAGIAREVGRPLLGTSDSHLVQQFGTTYSLIERELTAASVLGAIRKGQVEVVSRPLRVRELVRIAVGLTLHGSWERAVLSL